MLLAKIKLRLELGSTEQRVFGEVPIVEFGEAASAALQINGPAGLPGMGKVAVVWMLMQLS